MGTWSAPTTCQKAEILSDMMDAPVEAASAVDLLYDVMGDDGLFDMVAMAREKGRRVDVRPLIAMKLDEWLNWYDPTGWKNRWEPGAEERLWQSYEKALAAGDADGIVAAVMRHPGAAEARKSAAWALDLDKEEALALEVIPWQVEGTHAVVTAQGALYRVEGVWGTVSEAPEERRELILDRLRRPDQTAPRWTG